MSATKQLLAVRALQRFVLRVLAKLQALGTFGALCLKVTGAVAVVKALSGTEIVKGRRVFCYHTT